MKTWLVAWLVVLAACFALALACGSSSSGGNPLVDDDTTADDDVSPDDDDDASPDDDDDDDNDDDAYSDVWTDPATGHMWQVTQSSSPLDLLAATTYCNGLGLGGYGGWRLPDIDALRSLIRGCAATQTGGACTVTDECLSMTTCQNGACDGCTTDAGPANGCYWPSQIADDCSANLYWSSSTVDGDDGYAWGVSFDDGYVYGATTYSAYYVRCVRL